jgi:dephospho-CoA kinase
VTEAVRQRPVIIGLTGNIGTGKSTVAAMLADLGAEVIDADRVAHAVMRRGNQVHGEIVEIFGPGILSPDGQIARERLGPIVFGDPAALAKLEAIVHPAVIDVIDRRIAQPSADVLVIEAIKLLESSLADRCDSIWVTTSRPDQQIRRIVGSRNLSPESARQRVEAQPPQAEKVARADVVIDNDGSLSATREQVKSAWKWMLARPGRPGCDLEKEADGV